MSRTVGDNTDGNHLTDNQMNNSPEKLREGSLDSAQSPMKALKSSMMGVDETGSNKRSGEKHRRLSEKLAAT